MSLVGSADQECWWLLSLAGSSEDEKGVSRFKTHWPGEEGNESRSHRTLGWLLAGEVIMWCHPLGGREHWIKLSLVVISLVCGWVIRGVGRQLGI